MPYRGNLRQDQGIPHHNNCAFALSQFLPRDLSRYQSAAGRRARSANVGEATRQGATQHAYRDPGVGVEMFHVVELGLQVLRIHKLGLRRTLRTGNRPRRCDCSGLGRGFRCHWFGCRWCGFRCCLDGGRRCFLMNRNRFTNVLGRETGQSLRSLILKQGSSGRSGKGAKQTEHKVPRVTLPEVISKTLAKFSPLYSKI